MMYAYLNMHQYKDSCTTSPRSITNGKVKAPISLVFVVLVKNIKNVAPFLHATIMRNENMNSGKKIGREVEDLSTLTSTIPTSIVAA